MACAPTNSALPPIPEECIDNTPPFIGNLVTSSTCVVGANALTCGTPEAEEAILQGEEPVWELHTTFRWADPGEKDAGDDPNMVGGMISGENSIQQFSSLWLYDPLDFTPNEGDPYAAVERGATQGEFGLIFTPEVTVDFYSPVTVAFRVRDACDAVSNEIGCRYLFGTGEWIDCEPPAEAPEE